MATENVANSWPAAKVRVAVVVVKSVPGVAVPVAVVWKVTVPGSDRSPVRLTRPVAVPTFSSNW